MAHLVNVTPVHVSIETTDPEELVTDPVCGKELRRHDSKNMVFRETETTYFCGKECQQEFLSPTYKPRDHHKPGKAA
ncbi:MAG: hypothetical protein NDJ90_14445 [Oligoflexia bacterium]|nr:hypothetical protein [Oligoflexia bacterium]